MKSIAAIAIIGLALSGCGYKEVNQQIATSNENRLRIFNAGMIGCKDDAACKVGVAMAFAGNMGQQSFIKPESAKDYMVAATPILDILSRWKGNGNGANGGVSISDSDGASVFFMKGNTVSESQVYSQTTPTITKSYDIQTGTDDSANSGTYSYQPDSSTTDTK